MKARGRPRNIQKEPPREIISTTGKNFYVSRIQHRGIGHATGKVQYDGWHVFVLSQFVDFDPLWEHSARQVRNITPIS